MYRATFRTPTEDQLDALLPLLPAGVHEDGDSFVTYAAKPFDRAALELAAGPLEHWTEAEVPADWKARHMGRGVVIADRVCIRSPFDREPAPHLIDVVVERRGSAFGSGSHPTTQMCVALMLELTPEGGAADLGCGAGTLAIVAAKLGWAPVRGVDRVPVAIEVARENIARNEANVTCDVADLATDEVPLAALLLVNAPPPVHERVAAAIDESVRHVIVSGIVSDEVEAVVAGYGQVGFDVKQGLGTEDEWIALRLSC